jgi:hypothetical protein
MGAPVRFKPSDENDLATPAGEITYGHGVDRRSLLPPRRVMPQRGMPLAASAETSKPVVCPWTNRVCACSRAAVLDHAAPRVDLSSATSATGMPDRDKRGKDIAILQMGQDASPLPAAHALRTSVSAGHGARVRATAPGSSLLGACRTCDRRLPAALSAHYAR